MTADPTSAPSLWRCLVSRWLLEPQGRRGCETPASALAGQLTFMSPNVPYVRPMWKVLSKVSMRLSKSDFF